MTPIINKVKLACKLHPFNGFVITYVLLLCIFSYLSVVATYPFKIIEFQHPITFQKKEYKAGEWAAYEVHIKKYIQAQAVVTRQLVNGHTIAFTPIQSDVAVGETDKMGYIQIPEHTDTGEYKMTWIAEYTLQFPFYERTIKYRQESNPIHIEGISIDRLEKRSVDNTVRLNKIEIKELRDEKLIHRSVKND